MPLPLRDATGAAAYNERGYLPGGKAQEGYSILDNDEYEPYSDTWRTRMDMPGPRRNAHGVARK